MELKNLKGIGQNKIELLNKLNINNIEQLLTHYPFRYNIIKKTDIKNIDQDDKIIIDGIVETIPNIYYIKKNKDKMTFKMNIENNIYDIIIFNRGFLKSKLKIGTTITVIGKINKRKQNISAYEIRIEPLNEKPSIEPVYHTTKGITGKQINSLINQVLENPIELKDYIPNYLNKKYNLLDKLESIKIIHNPTNIDCLKKARTKLKYEELFIFMLKINYLKNKKDKKGIIKVIDYDKVRDKINNLPFKLTQDQLTSIDDIYNDFTSPKQMNRLLQGDVGCGKTIVAFISLYMNYLSNYQGCLMAPTELLANQHYENIKNILGENIKIELLTRKTKNKNKILEKLQNNEIDIIIGTHALLSDSVIFNNLGLVITDEQHRFGVNQRGNLKNKGTTPDILYMSATPIPRTYALTIYKDMEISSIKTMPSGRKNVKTIIKKDSEIKDVFKLINQELQSNHQIYVIAPLIENNLNNDLETIYELEDMMNKQFGKKYKIDILHGKMKTQEKEKIMNLFKDNKINILVSTTVIEVGIDIKNATVITIFDSHRFGLSALHQLRGRVGRNDLDSYCVLISGKETERLKILTKTNDGFKISEEDFKLRGSGDIFGIRQSGDINFSFANIRNDYNLLLKAKQDGKYFLEKNINKIDYKHIKDLLTESINLD